MINSFITSTNKRKYFWLDVAIGFLLVVYLLLLTAIFVVQKKIAILSKTSVSGNQKPSQTKKEGEPKENQQPNYQEKEQQLQETLAANPQDKKAHEGLAQLYYQQGQFAKTVEQYRNILELNPNDAEVHLQLGKLYMAEPRFTRQAVEHFQKVLAISPNHQRRKSLELWIKQLAKQPSQGKIVSNNLLLEHFQKILREQPNHTNKNEIEQNIQQLQEQLDKSAK